MTCSCGCGQETEIAKKTDSRRGQVKGQPMKYIFGHSSNNGPARESNVGQVAAPIEPGAQEITEQDIVALRARDDIQAADAYDARARYLERSHKRTFVEIGMICREVDSRKLWERIVDVSTGQYYASFDKWMMSAMPVSRSTAYEAKRALERCSEVPVSDLQDVPRCNIKMLANLSTDVQRQPEVIQAAKEMSEEDFAAKVEKDHPDQHIEGKTPIRLKVDKSVRDKIDRGLEVAMWAFGTTSREEALEGMVEAWLQTYCEVEGYETLTNRLAYEASRQKEAA